MPRPLMTVIGFLGLVFAAYLAFLHRPTGGATGDVLDRSGLIPGAYDGPLFGIAIAVLSIMAIVVSLRDHRSGATG